jgi:hypothetical protein
MEVMSLPDICVYQCPVCEMWQVDYSLSEISRTFIGVVVGEDKVPRPDIAPFHDAVNEVVEEHVREEHPLAYKRFKRFGRL